MSDYHRKQTCRYDVPGDPHFLTFSCFQRLPLLARERTCRFFIDGLQRSREKNPFQLWAFVIMPEHIHLVLLPEENVKIKDILSSLKQSVSKRAIQWLRENSPEFLPRLEDVQPSGKRCYRFWQRGGGYDRNLRSTRDIHEKLRYVHLNPVRRGLVARSIYWPWSSASAWESGLDDLIRIDRESVPRLTNLDDRIDSSLWL
ncbi:REP-associated tyrosine transposase [Blastopirellula marina]|uniref:Transposase IS200-like domain-containing protein n=1 Tax=Blastopirellula marina TaxID=124 RepID=A0A2S8GHF2_9BACT|nr:hypothetical protein C5Y93_24115 [Blastopirellula marina]